MTKKSTPLLSSALFRAACMSGAAAVYALLMRPRLLRWGAHRNEERASLPGDELVTHPTCQTTRALTIHAPARAIWPWLVQMGYQRGGFYSYDQLERLAGLANLHNAADIHPEWQTLQAGDQLLISPITPMRVEILEPEQALVLHAVMHPWRATPVERQAGAPFIDWSWAFILEPIDAHITRLLIRMRCELQPAWLRTLYAWLLLEPTHFIMERKMLLGLQQRAELGQRGRLLLDDILPAYDFNEVHRIWVNAPPAAVYTALQELKAGELSPLVNEMLALRGLPARLLGQEDLHLDDEKPMLDQLFSDGFLSLGQIPNQELVFGVIGQFWNLAGGSNVPLSSRQDFIDFQASGYAKVAANLHVQAHGPLTLLTTETRIWAPDEATRRKFSLYWRLISLGSGWIRLLWLSAIKRRAEITHLQRESSL